MRVIEEGRTIAKVSFVLAGINALFLFANGLVMMLAPEAWYHAVPGVSHTGPFNQHFVLDIGLVQMFMGGSFAIGMAQVGSRFTLWTAATVWLCAHAILHLWEVAIGLCPPSTIVRDFPAVTLPALIGIMVSAWAWRTRPYFDPFN